MSIAPIPPADADALAARAELEKQAAAHDSEEKAEKKEGFWRHPAVLLVLGFLCTGLIGSVVTSWWQYQQWFREQQYRAAADATKERLAVMTLTSESVADSFAAAEDVLQLFAFEWRENSSVMTLKQRAESWQTASRKWRVAEKVLMARIGANYDQKTVEQFYTITLRRRRLGNDITNLLSIADEKGGRYSADDRKEIKELYDDSLKSINEVTGKGAFLPALMKSMLAETRLRENVQEPEPIWRWIWPKLRR